jgi:hypothetical protein
LLPIFLLVVNFILLSKNSYAFTREIDGSICTFTPEYTDFWDDLSCCESAWFCSDVTPGSSCVPPLPYDQQVCHFDKNTSNCDWLPLASSVCEGEMFVQYPYKDDGTKCDNMGLYATGTKDCSTPLVCTSFTYSDWGECIDGTQTRTVLESFPEGCTGGDPILSQDCCISQDYYQCYLSDLYWYNSCDIRETKYKECGSSYCDTNGDVDLYCYEGNVWGRYDYLKRGCTGSSCTSNWVYNSCGEKILEVCSGSTDCGYGICGGTERPTNWGCLDGKCQYSCASDPTCIPPTAVIDAPEIEESPNKVYVTEGEAVIFVGSGTDISGIPITPQTTKWYLSDNCLSGVLLSSSNSFEIGSINSDITISLQIQDSNGSWSTNCPSRMITVQAPICINQPANSTIYTGDDIDLTADTPCAYSATNTSPKCQYYCNSGYTWNGSLCRLNAKCGTATNGRSYCDAPPTEDLCAVGSSSTVTSTGGNWTWTCSSVSGTTQDDASCSATVQTTGCGSPGNWREVNP